MAANIEGSCAIDPFKDRPVAQSKRFGREDETSLRMMISSNIRLVVLGLKRRANPDERRPADEKRARTDQAGARKAQCQTDRQKARCAATADFQGRQAPRGRPRAATAQTGPPAWAQGEIVESRFRRSTGYRATAFGRSQTDDKPRHFLAGFCFEDVG
jgi:hypothetical protein